MALGEPRADSQKVEAFDVLVIGAGVSGINAAYRLQAHNPDHTFAVIEGRGDIGGTWDLFRYPGIRSDSELFTYGFEWEPWPFETPIAAGRLIREYMKSCIAKYNLDRYIRFHHKVLAADWSSENRQWRVMTEHDGCKKEFRANFLFLGTGYYDYDDPLKADIPGLEDFKGQTVHPQHWPENYDYTGKKMVIIGSGATAVTLVPALAQTAGAVTMVQRSPTYIAPLVNESPAKSWFLKLFSKSAIGTWMRVKYLITNYIQVKYIQTFPQRARAAICGMMESELPKRIPLNPHFSPTYNPWEQRLCVTPDGDFFKAFRDNPNTNVVTGHIETVTDHGLLMKDGTTVEADVIVTATGLQVRLGGGIAVSVDGEKVDWAGRKLWHGSMVENVPNLMLCIGYVDAAWTTGADATAVILTRLLKHMRSKRVTSATPKPPVERSGITYIMFELSSSYVQKAAKRLPIYGNTGPWRPKKNPPMDWLSSRWGDIVTGLSFSS
ncbi:FAD/NAD(P)-binding domain-containing protein [Xylaria sp. CBS 124048]|nr:FAD/NAD(P)-binding domain-containing protein [Xylaria sp. CBS 124048]